LGKFKNHNDLYLVNFLCKSLIMVSFHLLVFISITNAQEHFLITDPLEGQEIFEAKGCQQCHGIRGRGGDIAKDLGWHEYYGSVFELAADLWNHSPIMREVMEELHIERPAFTEDDMSKLMSFLYYQRYLDKTGDVLKGKKLLSEKGCLKCHSVRQKGGTVGRRLDRLAVHVTPLFMAQAMWNHGPDMEKKMKELHITWPRFDNEEVVDLTNYLRILRMESPRQAVYLQPGNPASGKNLFKTKGCIHCHSVEGEGGGIALDVTQMELNKSVTEIAGRMWNHSLVMMSIMKKEKMEWPQFQGQEMGDLISYLYFINFTGQRGDLEQGKKVFKAKGCITCHSKREGMEPVGPDLSELKSLRSPTQLAQIMWNHAPNMETKMSELDMEWPQFSKGEMANLFEFLLNLNGSTEKN
ncbi:MAG: c-type cytochrome, partial [bacterium]